jgi:hypothetical protein
MSASRDRELEALPWGPVFACRIEVPCLFVSCKYWSLCAVINMV